MSLFGMLFDGVPSAVESDVSQYGQSGFYPYTPNPQSFHGVPSMAPWEPAPQMLSMHQFTQGGPHVGGPWSNSGFSALQNFAFPMSSQAFPSSYLPTASMPFAAFAGAEAYLQSGPGHVPQYMPFSHPSMVQAIPSSTTIQSPYGADSGTYVLPTSSVHDIATIAPPPSGAPISPSAAIDPPSVGNLLISTPEDSINNRANSNVIDAPLFEETCSTDAEMQGRPKRTRRVPKNPDGTQPSLPGVRDSDKETDAPELVTPTSPDKRKRGGSASLLVSRKKGRLH